MPEEPHDPTRSIPPLRRGVLHNACQREDGRWAWRHARPTAGTPATDVDHDALWDAVSALSVSLLLVRGMATGSVVDDEVEAEMCRRAPGPRSSASTVPATACPRNVRASWQGRIAGFVPRPQG